jgi:hypothetical protein
MRAAPAPIAPVGAEACLDRAVEDVLEGLLEVVVVANDPAAEPLLEKVALARPPRIEPLGVQATDPMHSE